MKLPKPTLAMARFLATVLAVSAWSPVAQAADWLIVGHKGSATVSVDHDSLRWRDDLATFWMKLDGGGATDGAGAYLVELSCSTSLIRLNASSASAGSGTPFGASAALTYTFQPVAGGVPSVLKGAVCGMRPVKAPDDDADAFTHPAAPIPQGRIAGPPLDH